MLPRRCWPGRHDNGDDQHHDEDEELFDRHTPVKMASIWEGNNKLLWNNRIVLGPDIVGLLITHILIFIPTMIYLGFVAPDWFRYGGIIPGIFILLAGVALLSTCVYFLWKTATMDPGYVPRNLEAVKYMFKPDETDAMIARDEKPGTKDVEINGMKMKIKYCKTCMIYRPPRTCHCKRCNACVERFDHHCPWTGTCIGIRNYRYFFGFVSTTTILCIFGLLTSAAEIAIFVWRATLPQNSPYAKRYHDLTVGGAFLQSLMSSPCSYIMIVYSFIMGFSVGGLFSFHSYLVCKNVTTYENISNAFHAIRNPFSKGIAKNVQETLFSPLPPSRVRFNDEIILDQAIQNADTQSDGDTNHSYSDHSDDEQV